jgi:hypothetical protein
MKMKKVSIKLLCVWICFGLFFPKEINAQWAKTFGGASTDIAYSVHQTADGGYILAGYTNSFGAGNYDFLLVKTDASGNLQWAKTFGGADYDRANSVQQTTDGGYILAGVTSSFGAGLSDVLLVKTDASGNLQWAKTFGGANYDSAYSVQQTTDGGYILAGMTSSFGAGFYDVFLVKTDASGNLQWAKTFGGSSTDYAYSVQQTTDGGYILAGRTISFGAGNYDFLLVKTDASGNLQWAKTFGGANYEEANSVQQTTDGGYILAGMTSSFGTGNYDFLLVKTDASGNLQWAKTFGGADYDWANSVQQTTDGGYILAGMTSSFGAGLSDVLLVKTDASGNLTMAKTFGGANHDIAYSVQRTTDGGYILAGWTLSFGAGFYDVFLGKTDASGNTCPGSNANPAVTNPGLTMTNPVPSTTSPGVGANANPVETSPSVTESGICLSVGENSSCFPKIEHFSFKNNKISLKFSGYKEGEIKIVIYDISGKEKFSKSLNLKPYIEIEDKKIEKLKSGIYFLKVYLGNGEIGGFKLIKK